MTTARLAFVRTLACEGHNPNTTASALGLHSSDVRQILNPQTTKAPVPASSRGLLNHMRRTECDADHTPGTRR